MKFKIAGLITLLIVIVLEILPYGAVCNFSNDPGETLISTFSYFNMIPFGYANFGPLLTAILSCVLILLYGILLFIKEKQLYNKVILGFSITTFITSIFPLFYGFEYYNIVGLLISALLALSIILFQMIKRII
jgi:hypothetical protein